MSSSANGRKRRLPPFLDHFSLRELKIFLRCWVAVWVAALLIFINPVASNFGQATFFACMVVFILPPSGVLFVYILGALSLFIGICLAWAWGVITMKAALAVRSEAETQARLGSLQQAAAAEAQSSGSSVAALAQRMIFDGWMLDKRVTAIIFCMLCVYIYLMARLRAANPKTALTAIFGIIIADIFLCYGPLLPSFNGTLPLSLVKPAAAGVGIGFACSLLFFPRSTSDIVLEGMEELIERLKFPLRASFDMLSKDCAHLDAKAIEKGRAAVIEEYRKLEPSFAFLPLDFSISSWGAETVQTFKDPIRQLVAAILALSEFHTSTVEGRMQAEDLQSLEKSFIDGTDGGGIEMKPARVGMHHLSLLADLIKGLQYTRNHSLDDKIAGRINELSISAMDACLQGLDVTSECIQFVGRQHWYHRAPVALHGDLCQKTTDCLTLIRETRAAFLQEMTDALVSAYAPVLGENTEENDRADQLAGMIICMNFQEHLANALDKTEALLACTSAAFPDAARTRLWWPTSLKYAVKWAVGKRDPAPATAATSENNPDQAPDGDATQAAQEKLRIRRGYRPQTRHPVGKAILGTYHWVTSDEGMYGLRMVVITIALAVPAVLPSSAGFFYREKGFWGLIMGQTALLVYMADFTFSVIARVAGTVGGGALGLVAWYIGSGNGPGNPYGLSAVLGVMFIFFLWLRLYLPPNLLQGAIMGAATFLLVVAYSYVDTHNPTYGNPGVGYNIFWRRLLLVLVGIAAATIVQILPNPPSAARHVCHSLSRSLRTLSDHYALLLSCWSRAGDDGKTITEPIWLVLTESLVLLDGPIYNLRFEFSSSRFDATSLGRVKQICHALNAFLARLLVASATLPQEYKDRLNRQMGVLDHRCIGEVMAVLGVCEQTLRTGDAPPEILPTPLVRRALEVWQARSSEYLLDPDMLGQEDYRRYCVALAAYLRFLGKVDELVLVIKGVLGEAHLVSRELIDLV